MCPALSEELSPLIVSVNDTYKKREIRKMNRRTFLKGTTACSGLLCFPFAGCSTFPRKPHLDNVILVTLDTLRADHMSTFGYPGNTTPFLDSLATRGTHFTRAYTTCPTTSPAHASMFTGLMPSQTGVRSNRVLEMHESIQTLPEMLHRLGFKTAAFVAVDFMDFLAPRFQTFDFTEYRTRDWYRPGHETLHAVSDWLENHPESERFFLWVHFFDPHAPYWRKEPYAFVSAADRMAMFQHWTEKQNRSIDFYAVYEHLKNHSQVPKLFPELSSG